MIRGGLAPEPTAQLPPPMSRLIARLTPAVLSAAVAGALFAACGGNAAVVEPALSASASAGREIVRSSGCAACHGRNGEGGTGPAFVGLYGSTVELRDADPDEEPTVADDDYLYESIADPGARRVAGYGFAMPTNDLTDAEIEQVIQYIREIADVADEEQP